MTRDETPRPLDWRRNELLEVLTHHLSHGAVWAGDQISKRARDDLVRAGMLSPLPGSGYHALTRYGSTVARRLAPVEAVYRTLIRRLPDGRIRSAFHRGYWRLAGPLANALTPPAPVRRRDREHRP